MGALMTTLQEKRRSVTMAGAGIFYPNVPRQVSLAGGAGGWNVGLVFIESWNGQRLSGRAR